MKKYIIGILLYICVGYMSMLHVEAATDLSPEIIITTEIPSETTSEELLIEGIVSDDKGIVTSSVRVFDSSGNISSIASLERIEGISND